MTILSAVPAFASAATTGSTASIVASVSFRTAPSTSSTVIKYLKAGETVTIVETVNAYWFKVKDGQGNAGYISSNEQYTKVIAQAAPGNGKTNAVIVSSVSFRKAPSTSGDRIRYLAKDEQVTITGQSNAYWYAVTDKNGASGYISTSEQYVRVTGSLPSSGGGNAGNTGNTGNSGNAGGVVNSGNAVIVGSVSFRKEPSTSGDRIRYLAKDEQVTITSKVNAYWYAVTDKNGVSGYISTSDQYVRVTGTIPGGGSSSGGSGSSPSEPSAPSASQQIDAVIAAGMKYLGTPYEYGSDRNTTKTFDCSDFVRQSFKDALSLVLPADSRGQGDYVRSRGSVTTDWHSLKRGDLMFFMSYKGTNASSYTGKSAFGETINHVGIYLGGGQVLHTYSKESGGVRVDSIEGKHWEYRFLYGGSAL